MVVEVYSRFTEQSLTIFVHVHTLYIHVVLYGTCICTCRSVYIQIVIVFMVYLYYRSALPSSLQHGQYSRSFVLEALEKYPIIVSKHKLCIIPKFVHTSSPLTLALSHILPSFPSSSPSISISISIFNFPCHHQLEGVVAHVLRFEVHPGLSQSRSRRHCEALKLAAGTEAGFYNERLLEYLHFVFCLCLLERLLLTRKGRELFPVTTKAGTLYINSSYVYMYM